MLFALVKEPQYMHHQWIMVQWSIHWPLVSAIGQLPLVAHFTSQSFMPEALMQSSCISAWPVGRGGGVAHLDIPSTVRWWDLQGVY